MTSLDLTTKTALANGSTHGFGLVFANRLAQQGLPAETLFAALGDVTADEGLGDTLGAAGEVDTVVNHSPLASATTGSALRVDGDHVDLILS
ncbi:hypothetical protein [Nesterenkonia sp. CF4.4]|uniref:hypothetical protein n=1 Tax=Nesterenkonia sp. CF4.4 TaxID=3373079 RepID=UPI003EE60842